MMMACIGSLALLPTMGNQCKNETGQHHDFCLLSLASLVVILALVPTLVIAYIYADQEWATTTHTIVFLKADSALDGV